MISGYWRGFKKETTTIDWQDFIQNSGWPQHYSTLLATVRKSDVAEVHNENDLNMLTHVAERTGNMSSYPVEESPPC